MVNLAAIPPSLRERPQWVLWSVVRRDGKPTKVPFTAMGECASSTASSTWESFETVAAAYEAGPPARRTATRAGAWPTPRS
jgi:putative DNA primase/helicase